MSLVVLHPRLYASLLTLAANPRKSLKVRREIEKLRAKKREEHRIQINLTQKDASEIAGIIYQSDLALWDTPEEILGRMEAIAKAGISQEGMANCSYVGYSSSEWKAMAEIASGLTSELDLTAIPQVIYYDITANYEFFEPYLQYMIGRSYGLRAEDEVEVERAEEELLEEEGIRAVEEAIANDPTTQFSTAFGAAVEDHDESNAVT